MNRISKLLLAALLCIATLAASAQPAHHGRHHGPHHAMQPIASPDSMPAPPDAHHANHRHMQHPTLDFVPVHMCYDQHNHAFAIIDSVDCAVDLYLHTPDTMLRIGRYCTDNIKRRHDLKNILRPVSVAFAGRNVVVLASASADSSFVAIVGNPDSTGSLRELSRRDFPCRSYAMQLADDMLIIAGRNPQGYDVNILPFGPEADLAAAPIETLHYHTARQSEKIQQTDPVGIGMSAVAVAVVFLALLCIYLILKGTGRLMTRNANKAESAPKTKSSAQPHTSADDEILAAIAAAVHLYTDELHDEESGVLTIRRIDGADNQWGAHIHGMNTYFSNRK